MFSHPKYTAITVSGKIAVGTTTLAKNLRAALDWKYQNAGSIQREFDRKEGRNDNESGAASRTDEHERSIEAMTEKCSKKKKYHLRSMACRIFGTRFTKRSQGASRLLRICCSCRQSG
ncbi:hypothetical protein IPH70_01845 [Candidatus Roizmanbacteria bacterium]|nr:MAG: hypothetical protein IPH70_01845 [Candidatus Roizmanbacteria bacterium]